MTWDAKLHAIIFGASSVQQFNAMRRNHKSMLMALIGFICTCLGDSSMPPPDSGAGSGSQPSAPPHAATGFEAMSRCDPNKCMYISTSKSKGLIHKDRDGYPLITLGYKLKDSPGGGSGHIRKKPTKRKQPVKERISRIMALARWGYKPGCEATVPAGNDHYKEGESYKQPDFRCHTMRLDVPYCIELKRKYQSNAQALSVDEQSVLLRGKGVDSMDELRPSIIASTYHACHIGEGCMRGGRRGHFCINPYHIAWMHRRENRAHRARVPR